MKKIQILAKMNNPYHKSDNLTPRELEVLNLMVSECTIDQIAASLFIGKQTVITHRKNMMEKLDAKNAVGIVVRALRRGILEI